MTDLQPLWDAARTALIGAKPAHDFLHVQRVTTNAQRIARAEGADIDVVTAAAVLHELVNLPKDHPRSSESGDLCANAARTLLTEQGWPAHRLDAVCLCIRDHAWSKGASPTTLEVAVLQDADRLDAIGAIGVARCMATSGELGRRLYNDNDPFCETRTPNDRDNALDHFFRKLLHIEAKLNTEEGRKMARERTTFLHQFIEQLKTELLPDAP
ncbi:MAG: hypothetical protein ACJAZO_001999 [Myxococcota bacterium]|jgi:uncharacterized protein